VHSRLALLPKGRIVRAHSRLLQAQLQHHRHNVPAEAHQRLASHRRFPNSNRHQRQRLHL